MILDVVIPAYNEAERILPTLTSYSEALSNWDSRLIVVDDGSQDGTAEKVEEIASSLPVPIICHRLAANSGKGAAVRAGFQISRSEADAVMFADADGSTPSREFENVIRAWQEGTPVVIGSRALGTEHVKQHWLRRQMGQTFNLIFRLLIPVDLQDTQCGFKLFDKQVVSLILEASRVEGFAFDVEWILIAQANEYAVKEIPVWWEHVEASRVHLVLDSFAMLRDLLNLRIRWVRGDLKKK